ncbi:EAL domain-containing protein [Skermanella pratensis]|uniref:EAL domain-containing protein n=1 Tax=Skermanella pratensis TaxID=2233999 RepID=UPI0013015FC7|nr:EAL domain-containing protein [Skermanella pratensis]
MIRKTFRPGATIFFEGQPADCAYIVERGQVEICATRDQTHITLATLGRGEIFGEMAVLDDSLRSAAARATEETEVLIIRRDQLKRRIQEVEPIVGQLLGSLISRFRQAQNGLLNDLPSRDRGTASHLVVSAPTGGTERGESALNWISREYDLERGLEAGEFEPFFQPIVTIAGGELAGFEALARWRHPDRGLVPPCEFIDLSEKSGLIRRMDLTIMAEACALLRQAAGDRPLPFLSVNLSSQHFTDMDVVGALAERLEMTGFPAERLKVELTETALVHDPHQAYEVMCRIKDLGATLALDDFGTGYSSLSYLHKFPFDVLKIDQSFVRALGKQGRTHHIVETIITLARRMGMEVVAEGVESADLIQPLRDLGCTFGQGYHYSRPVPADVMGGMLDQRR